MEAVASSHFLEYVHLINRIHLIEMIEANMLAYRKTQFRASLIANPITGVPYHETHQDQN